jgi:nicotinate-nucleotide adenylyltransferase
MTFVVATANRNKLAEMRRILANFGFDAAPPPQAYTEMGPVRETGDTFLDNALIKARSACEFTGMPAIGDDSGLCVEALGGEPGVQSRRYGGGGLDDGGLCEFLLEKMSGVEHRDAKFVSTVACVFPDGGEVSATGECRGKILGARVGEHGFGYDPVFFLPELGKSMAQLTPEEKDEVSHRGAALRAFAAELGRYSRHAAGGPPLRLGLFGGAFNPPHKGHIALASAAAEQLALDALFVIPSGAPPHKSLPPDSPPPADRLRLAELAFWRRPPAETSDCEMSGKGLSYTRDTIRFYRERYPGAQIFLITGGDMFATLGDWKGAREILDEATPAVGSRDRDDGGSVRRAAEILNESFGVQPRLIEFTPVEISSTRLREALRERGGREYLDERVYSYIIMKRLYGAKPDFNWLRARAVEMLDSDRVEHVLGCEMEAERLARRWGAAEDEAREAALLHDITKRAGQSEQLELCALYGIKPDALESETTRLLHSKTGAAVARARFGVSNEVYGAIKWHTTGRAGMTLLEKIMYMADYIEPTRVIDGVDRLRELAFSDLNRAMILGLEMSMADISERRLTPHSNSLEALSYLIEGITD